MKMSQLTRSLSWVQGTTFAIGAVLGSGILILPAVTAEQYGPVSILAWIGMALLSFPLAFTIGQLGAHYPHAGGITEYARLAFGAAFGRITGWLFLGTIPIGVPIIALVGAHYVAAAFNLTAWVIPWISAIMLAGSLYLNLRGVNLAGWVQTILLATITTLMLVSIFAAIPHLRMEAFHPFAPHGWLAIGHSAVVIFWSFVGWEMVAHLAEEFRNPARDLKRTFVLAPLLVGILYVALSFVTIGTHAYGNTDRNIPLSLLVETGFGKYGAKITDFIALLITLVAIHGNITGFSRMLYAQARSGDFPILFAKLHQKYMTPVTALIALAIDFAIVLTLYSVFHLSLGTLIVWPSTVFLVLYIITMGSALRLLHNNRLVRWSAFVSLMMCTGLLLFSGWLFIFPVVLGSVGWLLGKKKTNTNANY